MVSTTRRKHLAKVKKTCVSSSIVGEFPAIRWLGLGAFTAVAQVQSLVRELRSHNLCNATQKKGQLFNL